MFKYLLINIDSIYWYSPCSMSIQEQFINIYLSQIRYKQSDWMNELVIWGSKPGPAFSRSCYTRLWSCDIHRIFNQCCNEKTWLMDMIRKNVYDVICFLELRFCILFNEQKYDRGRLSMKIPLKFPVCNLAMEVNVAGWHIYMWAIQNVWVPLFFHISVQICFLIVRLFRCWELKCWFV